LFNGVPGAEIRENHSCWDSVTKADDVCKRVQIGLLVLCKELMFEGFSLYLLLSTIQVVASSHAFWNTADKETRNTKSLKFKLRIPCPKALIPCILVLWRELNPDRQFLLLVMVHNNSFTHISFTFIQEEWN